MGCSVSRRGLPAILVLLIVVIQGIAPIGSPYIASANTYVDLENPLDSLIIINVDGGVVVLPPHSRVHVNAGSMVCISDDYVEVYASAGIKRVFNGWIADGVYISSDKCIIVSNYTVVRPFFKTYYRVVITSDPPGVYYYSNWSEKNSILFIEAPRIVDNGSVRYVFAGWSDKTLSNTNTAEIPIVGPITLTVVYRVLYRVVLLGPNNSILRDLYVTEDRKLDLAQLYYNVSIFQLNRTVRYKLTGFMINNIALQDINAEIIVDKPLTIKPIYAKEYRVEIATIAENKTLWLPEGYNLTVNAPSEIRVNDTVKLEFAGWKDLGVKSTRLSLRVDKPVRLEALYRAKYKVVVNSPLGRGEYWVAKGEEFPLVLPTRLPGVVYDRVLEYYIVNNEKIPVPKEGILLIKVDKPLTITAVYVVKSNWLHLLILLGFILSVISLYIVFTARREEHVGQPVGSVEETSTGSNQA